MQPAAGLYDLLWCNLGRRHRLRRAFMTGGSRGGHRLCTAGDMGRGLFDGAPPGGSPARGQGSGRDNRCYYERGTTTRIMRASSNGKELRPLLGFATAQCYLGGLRCARHYRELLAKIPKRLYRREIAFRRLTNIAHTVWARAPVQGRGVLLGCGQTPHDPQSKAANSSFPYEGLKTSSMCTRSTSSRQLFHACTARTAGHRGGPVKLSCETSRAHKTSHKISHKYDDIRQC